MKLLPAILVLGWAICSHATDVSSRIVGYNVVDCPAGSDTIVSVPFHLPASFAGAVEGAPSVEGSEVTITPKASPVFSVGDFTTEAHYVQFVEGARAGWVFEVLPHGPSSITIDSAGEDLTNLADGDRFEVIPHWTLATLFPKETQTTIHESSSKLSTGRKSRILFFDETTDGVSLAPDRVFFLTADGWFQSAAGLPAADDVVVPPGKAFVIRHPATEAATKFVPHQMVVESSWSAPLKVRAAGGQDNAIALVRPIPVKLSELGLDPAAFVDSADNDANNRADELLVYDNLEAAINKAPSTIYFRVGGEWRLDDGDAGATYPVADDHEILPSTGLVLRKAAGSSDETLRWLNTPTYP
ncbi:MAG: TIGR02597 family protein [Verrucomicrobiales bacterium]|nr:TIGR02597 family protein [Verrucomicrobiales bacterium]